MSDEEKKRTNIRILSYGAIAAGLYLLCRRYVLKSDEKIVSVASCTVQQFQHRLKSIVQSLKAQVNRTIKINDSKEEKLEKIADAMENYEKSGDMDKMNIPENDQKEIMAVASSHIMDENQIEYPKFTNDQQQNGQLEQRRPWRRRWRHYWGRPWRNQWWWNRRLYPHHWNQLYNPYAGFYW